MKVSFDERISVVCRLRKQKKGEASSALKSPVKVLKTSLLIYIPLLLYTYMYTLFYAYAYRPCERKLFSIFFRVYSNSAGQCLGFL